MATTMAIMDFVQRFQALQIPRDNEEALIKDILVYCEALGHENIRLAKELNDAQLDLDDARRSRRDLQQQLNLAMQGLGQSNAEAEALRNRNSYIQVLIDGDGMIFNENLIRLGLEGGKQAAAALRNTVLQHYGELTDDVEVAARVYSNSAGLSNAMLRDGSLDDMDHLKNFMIGFTQGKASFDFVDVGHGKERADSKIRELTRWHLRNHNCKKLLLGISHDAGYAPFLDEVVKHNDRSRVTIIEGPPTVRELIATGLQITNFNSIFRETKLADRLKSISPNPLTTPAAPTSWAGVTSIPSATPSPIIISLTPKPTTPRPSSTKPPTLPAWTPTPRGLDPPIRVDSATMSKIKARTSSNKLCNNHYLRRNCAYGNECSFEHKHKVTDEEMKALEFMARLIPCTNGQECDMEDCIYGHHCPGTSVVGGKVVCGTYGCRFDEEGHPPGTVIKHPRSNESY